jgi:hypothetical protein
MSHANSLIINERSRASSEDSLAVRVTNVFCDVRMPLAPNCVYPF